MSIRCYHNKHPEHSEIVYVKVIEESEGLGFYCKLLEYGGLEGFIELKNLKRGRIRSIRQLIEVGKTMYLKVLATDVKNGKTLVILSKKGINNEKKQYALQRTNVVNSFLKLNNEITHMYKKYFDKDKLLEYSEEEKDNEELDEETSLEHQIMKHTVWRVQEESDNIVELYNNILENPNALVNSDFFEDKFKELYLNTFENRLIRTNAIVEQDFNLISYEPDGVEIVKNILHTINEMENVDVFIKTSPLYSIRCQGYDIKNTEKVIENCMNEIKNITSGNGSLFKVCGSPNVIAKEQTSLTFLSEHDINKMELENNQVKMIE
jgi:translation initiation factor 2 alpha subunit (eIF-2alpha)